MKHGWGDPSGINEMPLSAYYTIIVLLLDPSCGSGGVSPFGGFQLCCGSGGHSRSSENSPLSPVRPPAFFGAVLFSLFGGMVPWRAG